MRSLTVAVAVAVAAVFGSSGVSAAAPKDYCADLKGGNTGTTCVIELTDPAYSVDITFPLSYPDLQPVADFISQTRDAFLSTAKSGAPRDTPYSLTITPTAYSSAIPPRGTQAVVLKVTQNVGGTGSQTTFKSFNWDQSFRKAIIWTAAPDNPANYQSFAVVNDGITFFFDQGTVLPASYGPLQVLAPRSQIDPMIA